MTQSDAGSSWRDAGSPPEQRAKALLAAMTLEEKEAVAAGEFDAVAHLGVPPLRYTDGPNGVRGPDTVTAFPASLALAATFDEGLVAAVAAANPRTMIVVNTSGPVLMPWLAEVGAVLQVWHPGQQFGAAVAAVLFGDADPGGRLPLTFPATPEQGPITRVEQYPGVEGEAHYDEGILVGYRWYDKHDQQPLFPFGHGLSYGEFRYAEPRVDLDEARASVRVSVEIANLGNRSGSEVPQLYLATPAAADEPPRRLRGFTKVRLANGASTVVAFELGTDDLAAFDESSGRWVVHDGRYEALIGRSSRDVRGTVAFEVRAGRFVNSAKSPP